MTTTTTATRTPCAAERAIEAQRERGRRTLGDPGQLDPSQPTDRNAAAIFGALNTFGTGGAAKFRPPAEVEAVLPVSMNHRLRAEAWTHLWQLGLVQFMTHRGRTFVRPTDALNVMRMRRSGEPIPIMDLE